MNYGFEFIKMAKRDCILHIASVNQPSLPFHLGEAFSMQLDKNPWGRPSDIFESKFLTEFDTFGSSKNIFKI